jgi:hypothetical protein
MLKAPDRRMGRGVNSCSWNWVYGREWQGICPLFPSEGRRRGDYLQGCYYVQNIYS